MKRAILVVGVLLAVANVASAELVQAIKIDFVTIGHGGAFVSFAFQFRALFLSASDEGR